MLQFPKDLEKTYANARSLKGEAQAFYIEKNKTPFSGNVLQTTHCIEIVLSGNCYISSPVDKQFLEVDDIQFRKRGNYIMELSNDYSSITYYFENAFILDFLKEHVITYSKETIYTEIPPFTFKSIPFILSNVKETIDVINRNREYRACITKFSLHHILLQILDKANDNTYVSFLKYLVNDKKVDLSYYMEKNFTQNLNLKILSKQTGRSLSTFKSDFKKEFNTTPMKWLLNRRLMYANHLISTSNHSISNIAYKSGFENISHFSRVFKEKYGSSPLERRKKMRH